MSLYLRTLDPDQYKHPPTRPKNGHNFDSTDVRSVGCHPFYRFGRSQATGA